MSFRKNITISTKARNDFKDVTHEVQNFINESQVKSGIILLYVPHTTAGITINENADVDVRNDIIKQLDVIIPWSNNYRHFEGNSAAHLKASMMGAAQTLIIEEGKLFLGTWQGIFFTEFDGPRKRTLHMKIMED